MISLTKALFFTSLITVASSSYSSETRIPKDFKIPAVFSSEKIDRESFNHKVTVLEFWASWCTSCGETMVKITDQLKATGSVANFIAVSVDEEKHMVSGYFDTQSKKVRELEKNVFIDSGLKLAEPLSLTAIPTILVIDKDGRVSHRLEGKPNTKQIQTLISKIRLMEVN